MSETACPCCGGRGRRVPGVTLLALVAAPPPDTSGWRFCGTPRCEVVYFGPRGEPLRRDSLRVRVGQKEDAPDRPLCYCFGHSAADILADPRGVSDAIKARCRLGQDRCEETNPKGSCCLGEVLALARREGGRP